MKSRAAVAFNPGKPLEIVEIDVEDPKEEYPFYEVQLKEKAFPSSTIEQVDRAIKFKSVQKMETFCTLSFFLFMLFAVNLERDQIVNRH